MRLAVSRPRSYRPVFSTRADACRPSVYVTCSTYTHAGQGGENKHRNRYDNGADAMIIVGVDVTMGENHRLHRFHTD
jgi:hypothetical protein